MNQTQTRETRRGLPADTSPQFLLGDNVEILGEFYSGVIDTVLTSPPYWGKREYHKEGIGLESSPAEYIKNMLRVTGALHRVLKPTGSFWLNIGDSYQNKNLVGIPWKLALQMQEKQGWIVRNAVIWSKHKGSMTPSKDRFGNSYEYLFHFVKQTKYYYDSDSIRNKPRSSSIKNGAVTTATGVTGIRYRRQIELSTALSEIEKKNAYEALEGILKDVSEGRLSDFRMIIRGQQRTTHSESEKVSGRAKDLASKGFYFLKYHPKGAMLSDVWDIIPEDTQKRELHYAPFPEDLCKIPILATCPSDGVVLDPFCGTGTTNLVAYKLNRKSIGIDLVSEYLDQASKRIGQNGNKAD